MGAANSIVVTSINPPTTSTRELAALEGWSLVVVGDRKTPTDWALEDATFLPYEDEPSVPFGVAKLVPPDHYARKMLGYLWAIERGARIIVDTDDDNAPTDAWGWPGFSGAARVSPPDRGFVNVYRNFTGQHIWPRGFPLGSIRDDRSVLGPDELRVDDVEVGIWQGLADGDPDVDAIYRLVVGDPCTFDAGEPIVLSPGTVCPVNSQNTAFRSEVFPLLYLPAHVSFRFTDILRGLIAQPILWQTSYRVGFTRATVFQDRNPHDYLADFVSEIPCYVHAEKVVDVVTETVRPDSTIADNLFNAYDALVGAGIVLGEELPLLEAWLGDLSSLRSAA
jgi:STELLO glycosyltransferase-like protein